MVNGKNEVLTVLSQDNILKFRKMQLYLYVGNHWSLELWKLVLFRQSLFRILFYVKECKLYIYIYQFVFRAATIAHLTKTYIWVIWYFSLETFFLTKIISFISGPLKIPKHKAFFHTLNTSIKLVLEF